MRIALVVEQIDRRRGGAETSVTEFAAHMAAAGVDVCCLTAGGTPGREGGVEVQPVWTGGGPRWWRYKKFLDAASLAARQGSFDLVHAIVPCDAADIYQPRGGTVPETMIRNLALTKPGWRRSLKQLGQNLSLKHRIMATAERNLLTARHKPVVACVSSYVARQVQQHYSLSGPNVRVIFNGVNPDLADSAGREADRHALRTEWGVGPDTVVFGTVAHNFKLKGIHRLVQAAGLVRAGGGRIALVIAGKGRPGPYQRLARKCGISDAVRFVGPVSNVWALYHAVDACVLASYYDPCSRVVLEALTAGVPCITTRYNGAGDVIVDGENGYVVQTPDDVAALADRMQLLLDSRRRGRMAQAACQLREQVSMARHASQMLVLYEQVVREKMNRT